MPEGGILAKLVRRSLIAKVSLMIFQSSSKF